MGEPPGLQKESGGSFKGSAKVSPLRSGLCCGLDVMASAARERFLRSVPAIKAVRCNVILRTPQEEPTLLAPLLGRARASESLEVRVTGVVNEALAPEKVERCCARLQESSQNDDGAAWPTSKPCGLHVPSLPP